MRHGIDARTTTALTSASRCTLGTLAAGVLLCQGCVLSHSIPLGRATPQNFCPGDTVSAGFDLIGVDNCVSRPGLDCANTRPRVSISSAPEAFPAQTINDYRGRIDFAPEADNVAVSFSAGPGPRTTILLPTLDAGGNPTTRAFEVINNSATVRRINGSGRYELLHHGICAGPTPAHAPALLPGPPLHSANLRLGSICNPNDAAVAVTVAGNTLTLRPGDCVDPSPPGSPGAIGAGAPVEIRALSIDPAARCGALEGGTPPSPLRLQVDMACG